MLFNSETASKAIDDDDGTFYRTIFGKEMYLKIEMFEDSCVKEVRIDAVQLIRFDKDYVSISLLCGASDNITDSQCFQIALTPRMCSFFNIFKLNHLNSIFYFHFGIKSLFIEYNFEKLR